MPVRLFHRPAYGRGEVSGADLVIRYQNDTGMAEETLEQASEEEREALKSLPVDVQTLAREEYERLLLVIDSLKYALKKMKRGASCWNRNTTDVHEPSGGAATGSAPTLTPSICLGPPVSQPSWTVPTTSGNIPSSSVPASTGGVSGG